MSDAGSIFATLCNSSQGKTPEQHLLYYCQDVWSGVERLHFDFKMKRDSRHSALDDDDKKNLAKAVSGFANSGGGVLIWGIEDHTAKPKPICDPDGFLERLLQLAPNVTDPVVRGIDGHVVKTDDGNAGYIILLIPESNSYPHRVILSSKDCQGHYFVRCGSSFLVASHVQLEDMFGRRPKPKLELAFEAIRLCDGLSIPTEIIVSIRNTGRGIAKYPFVTLDVACPYLIAEMGLDGWGKSGLPVMLQEKQVSSGWGPMGYLVRHYGGDAGVVIHSGMSLKLAKIYQLAPTHHQNYRCSLVATYEVAAEGCPLEKRIVEFNPGYVSPEN